MRRGWRWPAAAARPSLVLLDEPHAALDADGMALVDRLLQRWHEAGVTVLVASHQAERVTRLADGWARLDGGLLVEPAAAGWRPMRPTWWACRHRWVER